MRKLFFLLCFVLIYANDVKLNKEESLFIKEHSFKCITTATWAPFNTFVNNKLDGISVDYWKLIKNKLHIKSHCIISPTWSNVLDAIKNERADISLGTDITPSTKDIGLFSKPYATFPIAIATRNNVGFIASMRFLKNKIIVVGKNYTAYHLLKRNYPDYNIVEVENTKKALEMVSSGKAYAAIDIMPVLVYNINKYEFANLKIAGKTPWVFKMRFILAKKDKPLLSAINKAIDTITENQRKNIYKKWVQVTYQTGYSIKDLLLIVGISIGIIALLIFWINQLNKEIKKRKEIERELQKLSIVDSLTGIFNRYKIDTALKQQIAYSKRHFTPLSVIFFDIDDFKQINDKYGHSIGDKTLRELTKLIQRNLREYDIFGRWGGEEFIIILPNTSLIQAVKVAKKLKNALETYKFKYIDKLTCSFGVTELMECDSSDSLLERVDEYMYKAKKRGKNQIVSDLN